MCANSHYTPLQPDTYMLQPFLPRDDTLIASFAREHARERRTCDTALQMSWA